MQTNETTEEILFQTDQITVTKTRAIIGTQTFAIANVTSVNVVKGSDDSMAPVGCLLIGILAILVGLAFGVTAFMRERTVSSLGNGVAILAVGAALFFAGWRMNKDVKVNWVLSLRTAGSEIRVLSSTNKELIAKAADAVSKAIVARG